MSVNLLNLQWRAPEFLLACPTGTLATRQLALEYFTLSPFFDKASSNAQLRMQIMFSRGGMDGVDEEAELARFTGIEFVIAHAQPPDLFILHKRRRTSPTETTVVGAYHVLNGNVYQAPSLFEILNQRLLTSVHALETSFAALTAIKPTWTPERQYTWDVKPPPVTTIGAAAARQELDSADPAGDDPVVTDSAGALSIDASATVLSAQERLVAPGSTADPIPLDAKPGDGEPRPDEVERPADAFNPLLFRALQRVAQRTEHDAIRDYEREQQHERERERERERDKREASSVAPAVT